MGGTRALGVGLAGLLIAAAGCSGDSTDPPSTTATSAAPTTTTPPVATVAEGAPEFCSEVVAAITSMPAEDHDWLRNLGTFRVGPHPDDPAGLRLTGLPQDTETGDPHDMRWVPGTPIESTDVFDERPDNERFPAFVTDDAGVFVCDANTTVPIPDLPPGEATTGAFTIGASTYVATGTGSDQFSSTATVYELNDNAWVPAFTESYGGGMNGFRLADVTGDDKVDVIAILSGGRAPLIAVMTMHHGSWATAPFNDAGTSSTELLRGGLQDDGAITSSVQSCDPDCATGGSVTIQWVYDPDQAAFVPAEGTAQPPPSTLPPGPDRSDPEAVGRSFLESWQAGDLNAMDALSVAGTTAGITSIVPSPGEVRCFPYSDHWECGMVPASGPVSWVRIDMVNGEWTVYDYGQVHGDLDP